MKLRFTREQSGLYWAEGYVNNYRIIREGHQTWTAHYRPAAQQSEDYKPVDDQPGQFFTLLEYAKDACQKLENETEREQRKFQPTEERDEAVPALDWGPVSGGRTTAVSRRTALTYHASADGRASVGDPPDRFPRSIGKGTTGWEAKLICERYDHELADSMARPVAVPRRSYVAEVLFLEELLRETTDTAALIEALIKWKQES